MNGQGREQFRLLINAEEEPSSRANTAEILAPLHDLVGALNDSEIGAALVDGPGGRVTLTLWPQHRPGRRSLMLPFVREHDKIIALLSAGQRSFQTAEDLRVFLTEFAGRPEFMASLAYLRDEAQQPVEAALRSLEHSLMIEIGARDQRRLGEAASGQVLELSITLEEGETVPATFSPTSLLSAGLRFQVVSSRIDDRTISLEVRKL
jgi:hypothetical protein